MHGGWQVSCKEQEMKSKSDKKMSKVMREYKAGTLNSGSKTGPVVKSRKQAIAIGLSQAGKKKSSY
jgi:ribosomal protein L21E